MLAAPPRGLRERVRIPAWPESGGRLEEGSLKASVGGEKAEVVGLHGPDEDLMLLVILDLVGDLSEIDLARTALVRTISEMPDNVYIGLMKAQDGLHVLQDPTKDREVIIKKIGSLQISGTPGLLETIETASHLADSVLEKSWVRMAILYITDSDVRDYREDFTNPVINYSDSRDLSRRFPEGLIRERMSKIDAKLGSSLTPIFAVHLEYSRDRLNEAYQSGLLQVTAATGGEAVFCRTNSEISTAIEAMFRKIIAHYGVDLEVTGRKGENLEVSLQSPTGPLQYRNRIHLKN